MPIKQARAGQRRQGEPTYLARDICQAAKQREKRVITARSRLIETCHRPRCERSPLHSRPKLADERSRRSDLQHKRRALKTAYPVCGQRVNVVRISGTIRYLPFAGGWIPQTFTMHPFLYARFASSSQGRSPVRFPARWDLCGAGLGARPPLDPSRRLGTSGHRSTAAPRAAR